ncbi:MAG: TonB-dependent receptor plug domain-containing protein [Bacteroidales bacterium]|nr:TonB-dependent receptor plug domain-containing protein [Bacteroidales bacterium]
MYKTNTIQAIVKKTACISCILTLAIATPAQPTSELRGIVVNEHGFPIEGVQVQAEGAENVYTGTSGTFVLHADTLPETVTLTMDGYEQDVQVNAQKELRIPLLLQKPKVQLPIPTSLEKASPGFLQARNDYLAAENPLQALEANITGLQVKNTSGAPGDQPMVTIRGLNTYLFNHDPLILLDGAVILDANAIDYDQIEKTEVVKDIASTSLYGNAGSKGVVLLTSKQGKQGDNKLSFSMQFGQNSMDKRYPLLNGAQAFKLMQDLDAGDTLTDLTSAYSANAHVTDSNININNLYNTNWQNELFGTGLRQSYNLSLTGGSDKSNYVLSGSYLKNEGIIKPSDYSRYSILMKLDQEVTDRLNISGGVNFSRSLQKIVNTGTSAEEGNVVLSALAAAPYAPAYDAGDNYFINPINPEIDNVYALRNGVNNELSTT